MPSSQHGRTATGPGFTRGNICRRSQPPIEDEEVFVKVNVNVKARERAEAGKGEIFAWCWYDFANSAFVTVVVTVVGGVFFTQSVCAGAEWAEFLWGSALSASAAVAMLAGPILGRWADRRAAKKPLLVGLTVVCVLATSLMGLSAWGVAVVTGLVVAANSAFLLGENLVAAFLPELAPPGKRGRISAYGWGFGYVGGLASLDWRCGFCLPAGMGRPGRFFRPRRHSCCWRLCRRFCFCGKGRNRGSFP